MPRCSVHHILCQRLEISKILTPQNIRHVSPISKEDKLELQLTGPLE